VSLALAELASGRWTVRVDSPASALLDARAFLGLSGMRATWSALSCQTVSASLGVRGSTRSSSPRELISSFVNTDLTAPKRPLG